MGSNSLGPPGLLLNSWSVFLWNVKKRQNARNSNKKIQDKQESKQKRWKRKYGNTTVSNTKKANISYGSQIVEHYTANELDVIKTNFLAQNVIVSLEKIKQIELKTKQ